MSMVLNLTLAALLAQSPAQPPPAAPEQQGEALAMQVALDRAGFSPGPIDGQMGRNTWRALDAYRKQHGMDPLPAASPLTTYGITDQDVSGPFAREIPPDLMEQARLPTLSYTSPLEALAERYHGSPQLLKQLNPQAAFTSGEQIQVPDVEPFIVPPPRETTGTSGKAEADAVTSPPKPDVVWR